MTTKILSEFKEGYREALVGFDDEKDDYFVILREHDNQIETRYCLGHNEIWAEEIAENWCQGILNVD